MKNLLENLNRIIELLSIIIQHINDERAKSTQIEWVSVADVAELKGLTPDSIRKKLQNGDFEEGVDFKYKGSKILVNQGAVERIQRQRRSSNG